MMNFLNSSVTTASDWYVEFNKHLEAARENLNEIAENREEYANLLAGESQLTAGIATERLFAMAIGMVSLAVILFLIYKIIKAKKE